MCSCSVLRFRRTFQVSAQPNEPTRSRDVNLLNDISGASLWRLLQRPLKPEFIFSTGRPPRGDRFSLLCFISSSLNCKIVFQLGGNEIALSTWWNNGHRLVDCFWEWAEGWGYVFSAAATIKSMVITGGNGVEKKVGNARCYLWVALFLIFQDKVLPFLLQWSFTDWVC